MTHPEHELIDFIGVGALNYDFVTSFRPTDGERSSKQPDSGNEDLGYDMDDLVEEINQICFKSNDCHVRFGGSAYLTTKALGSLGLRLSTGFVGVAGTPGDLEKRFGNPPDQHTSEFSHLSSTDWLFRSDSAPGRALVLLDGSNLRRGKRHGIHIASGANDELLEEISKKEHSNPRNNLIDYFAHARWVHISSLKDAKQFAALVEKLRIAKIQNPFLRVSIDPGDHYTSKRPSTLASILNVADFIFINAKELNNLRDGKDFKDQARIERLKSMMRDGSQVFVVKGKAKTQLLQLHQGEMLTRTFWHEMLPWWRIRDDTGAGDVFAAGVIAALLTPQMLAYQPATVGLGAHLARRKLVTSGFPIESFASDTADYIKKGRKLDEHNLAQRLRTLSQSAAGLAVGFIVSFVAGVASGWIFS